MEEGDQARFRNKDLIEILLAPHLSLARVYLILSDINQRYNLLFTESARAGPSPRSGSGSDSSAVICRKACLFFQYILARIYSAKY